MNADGADTSLGRAIVVLRGMLAQLEASDDQLTPWRGAPARPVFQGRVSATDQLSWWFRPASGRDDPWDAFFSDEEHGAVPGPRAWPPAGVGVPAAGPAGRHDGTGPAAELPSDRTSLRMLLAEPEEELVDGDAESVVTCLYDFVHALGRRDVDAAMACVAPDYHALEDDREIDADGLAARIRALLDSLHGWEAEVFLVEIPQPVLHPAGILVPVEIHVDAREPGTDARRSILDNRIAVFARQPDHGWRIAALAAV